MGLRINQNIAALNAHRNLSVTDGQMSKSLEKLSSGFRINRAADDAAGLAISEGLRSQIGGLKVAVRNTQDGISVVQTAEGALTETHSILQRMRDLSVQASSGGSLNDDAKKNIQSEIGQLQSELTRIAETTTFNGTKLLDGSYKGNFQVGANAGESISVVVGTSTSARGLGVNALDVTVADPTGGTTGAVVNGDGAAVLESVTATGEIGAGTFNGKITWEGKTVDLTGISQTETDAAKVTAIKEKVADALGLDAAQVTYTAGSATAAGTLAVSSAAGDFANKNTAFTAQTGAEKAIVSLDKAIKSISTTRADLGAIQNRFDHTINNLSVAVENLSASESRIRDADMAQEMVQFTRNQILSQAGTAMLAQANQASQGVLSLLR
ncbi:flagellin [Blastococcus capsensis]|uniref:flagellin N-terminal helical domain-containing protein n=2 Tax=Bacillati TaxID=1783272 RepID=UPI002540613A|nr:flagellin [Blastococcus capsensis]MDK3257417.1 flagellin [Blastococcus capsensis]